MRLLPGLANLRRATGGEQGRSPAADEADDGEMRPRRQIEGDHVIRRRRRMRTVARRQGVAHQLAINPGLQPPVRAETEGGQAAARAAAGDPTAHAVAIGLIFTNVGFESGRATEPSAFATQSWRTPSRVAPNTT